MKLAALRCPNCGRVRHVTARERGAVVACDGCDATIDVPSSLAFPGYADLYGGVALAQRFETQTILCFVLGCLPAAAWVWWTADGAIGRRRDEGLPAEPRLLRARRAAAVVTVIEAIAWGTVIALQL